MVIAPAESDVVVPVAALMVASRSVTLSPMPMLVPLLVELPVKVKVVPLTTSVSPVVRPLARACDVELEVPDSSVEPVIAADEVELLSTTAVPVEGVEDVPRMLLAVAPVSCAEVTFDFVE